MDELAKFCRLCASDAHELKPIFSSASNSYIENMVRTCCPVKITKHDELPTFLCRRCYKKLEISYNLHHQILDADRKLNELMEQIKIHELQIKEELDDYDEDAMQIDRNDDSEDDEGSDVVFLFTDDLDHLNEIINDEDGKEKLTHFLADRPDSSESNMVAPNDDDDDDTKDSTIKLIVQQPETTDEQNDDGEQSLPVNIEMVKVDHYEEFGGADNMSSDEVKNDDIGLDGAEFEICHICGKLLKKKSLPRHMKDMHQQKPKDVGEVKVESARRVKNDTDETQRSKEEKSSSDQTRVCHICAAIVKKATYTTHVRDVHRNLQLECNICNKVFKSKQTLSRHKQTHDDLKLPCNDCGKTYSTFKLLRSHMQHVHEDPHKHKCNICGKGFPTRTKVQYHMLTHTGETPYQCSVCPQKFKNQWYCKQHELTHTKDNPYYCRLCNKYFTGKGNLLLHIRSCHCKLCNETFNIPSQLSDHLIVTHKTDGRTQKNIREAKMDMEMLFMHGSDVDDSDSSD